MKTVRLSVITCVLVGAGLAQNSALAPLPRQQPLDNSGRIQGGACLYAYAAGTTNPQDTYNASDLAVGHKNTNPIVLDAFGRAPAIYLTATAYKFVLGQKALGVCPASPGTVVWTQDNVFDVGQILKRDLADVAYGASYVAFKQTGAGAVNRTLQQEAAERFSVTQYGADPTGAANSTLNIQNAATAAAGKELYIPAGTYLVSASADNTPSITIPSNTTVRCAATGATIKTADSGARDGAAIFGTVTGTTGVLIENCKLNGNRLNNANGGMGIRFTGTTKSVIRNVSITGTRSHPIELGESSNDNVVESSRIDDWGAGAPGYGFGIVVFNASHRNRIANNALTCGATSGYGLAVDATTTDAIGAAATHNTFSGNTVVGCAYGALIEDSDYNTLVDNTFDGQTTNGIFVWQGQIAHLPTGNIIRGNRIVNTAAGATVALEVSGNYNIVDGNLIYNAGFLGLKSTGSATAGNRPSRGNQFINNTIDTVGATAIYIEEGTDLTIGGNVIRSANVGIDVQPYYADVGVKNLRVVNNNISGSAANSPGIRLAVATGGYSETEVSGNVLRDMATNGDGILLNGGARVNVIRNTCLDLQAVHTMRHCINTNGFASELVIGLNRQKDITGSLVNLAGSTLADAAFSSATIGALTVTGQSQLVDLSATGTVQFGAGGGVASLAKMVSWATDYLQWGYEIAAPARGKIDTIQAGVAGPLALNESGGDVVVNDTASDASGARLQVAGPFRLRPSKAFADLAALVGFNGLMLSCTDCDTPAAPGAACSSAGDKAGAEAHYIRGAWICF